MSSILLGLIGGEFGVLIKADSACRQRWITFVRQQAEARGFSWLYWGFCADFRVYNCDQAALYSLLLDSLIAP